VVVVALPQGEAVELVLFMGMVGLVVGLTMAVEVVLAATAALLLLALAVAAAQVLATTVETHP
jgi:hypothetical protein